MNFALLILGPPYSTQAAASALRFARATLASGHGIYRLFFYHDGVHNASSLVSAAQDEISLPQQWQALIEQHKIDSVVCIAAATRRGVLNEQEAKRQGKTGGNLIDGHELSGLGQLVDAATNADRVITFG
ncbi:MAG: sulfurtransferase complex subunit TusD [Gammaproteobacteria bacterium]|nr:sulfurtransferase complex subunit TusD [Gammaproteobacteria bacterium]MBQ0838751.1 sulfurtransferase complex subunit TusD [Gammaproteobacteria bacterium]